MKTSSRLKSYLREFRFLIQGVLSRNHPVLAHVIPMRRCNLSCAYCNEYDTTSDPVELTVMIRREYLTPKVCSPFCTIACVHQVAAFDFWRDPQTLGKKGEFRRPQPVPGIDTLFQIE